MATSVSIIMRQIKPDPINVTALQSQIEQAMEDTARETLEDFEAVVSTWNHPVTIQPPVLRSTHGQMIIEVAIYDAIFNYLDKGTSTRWAIMSDPFVPKTRVGGHFKSGNGVGYAVVRGSSHMKQARPGIQAREWTRRIANKHAPIFGGRLRAILKNTLKPHYTVTRG